MVVVLALLMAAKLWRLVKLRKEDGKREKSEKSTFW